METDREAFGAVASVYDELMAGVPYRSWEAYLHRILKSLHVGAIKVLDLACGTGNMSELLMEMGMRVTGVDIAPAMIEQARRKAAANGLSIEYFVQDAAELCLPGRTFDLCVSLFDSMNYILDPARLEMAICRVAEHLRPGGAFIFDMNSEYALKHHFFDQDNLAHDEPLRYDWRSEYDAKTRICTVNMSFFHRLPGGECDTFEETHRQFGYRKDEVRAMMTRAGFTRIKVLQAYTMRAAERTADRLFYVGVLGKG